LTQGLARKAENYLNRLCVELPSRRVGSEGNRAATAFFAEIAAGHGFHLETQEFRCIDWVDGGASLSAGGDSFEVCASPYSLGVRVVAPMAIASTVQELERAEVEGKVLLMRGELTREQLMPVNFPFYKPDEHQRIIRLLQAKKPAAIAAATTRNPELAGAVYPFPLIEDGDFDIPSVYTTAEEGARLATHAGQMVSIESRAGRIPSWGWNVVARRPAEARRRVVLCAHIDAKPCTPGALDNAAGVTVLLLLAGLLKDFEGGLAVELVAMNGEDYYAAPGELSYLEQNREKLGDIILSANLDAPGYQKGDSAYSLYGCPDEIARTVRQVFSARRKIHEGEPWYQGDHMVFVQSGVPALAITSELFMEIESTVAHTTRDRPHLVDPGKLVDLALALRDLIPALPVADE
jgi:aminopeptidase YwaD